MVRIFNQYFSAKTLLLVCLESVLIVVSLICGVKLRFWNDPGSFSVYTAFPDFALQVACIVLLIQICFYCNELYDRTFFRSRGEELLRLSEAIGAACVFLGFAYFVIPTLFIGRGVLVITVSLTVTSAMLVRIGLDYVWPATGRGRNTIILGTGDLALMVARAMEQREHELDTRLVGFVSRHNSMIGEELFGRSVLGPADRLELIVARNNVSRIVVAMEDARGSMPVRELVTLRVRGVVVEDAHTALAGLTGRVQLKTVRPSWFVFTEGFHRSRLTIVSKRILDLSCGVIGLGLSAPIMLLVAIAVKLDSKGPVLYRQARVGLRGKAFKVMKFRSMRIDAESVQGPQWAQENDPRITRVGKYLRKFRLDEFPQFINVIRGDMSFVGPRPERPVFVERLRQEIPFYDERHSVRPGLTGWAQVKYPYGASIEDSYRKLEYDLFYLKNMSVLFDCAIIFQTIRTVLFQRGAC